VTFYYGSEDKQVQACWSLLRLSGWDLERSGWFCFCVGDCCGDVGVRLFIFGFSYVFIFALLFIYCSKI